MPKQKGYIKLKGTMDELTFYQSGGEHLVRGKGSLDKERILKDPSFRRTRENMSEFGGAAYVGSEFRKGLSSLIQKLGDGRVTGRITGIMRKINAAGSGRRGQRSFDMLANKRHLVGFEFNRFQPLHTVLRKNFIAPEADANRSVVTWTMPDFVIEEDMKVPEGATHFQLVLASTVLSDYEYHPTDLKYVAVEPDLTQLQAVAESDHFPTIGTLGGDVTLTLDLGLAEALPDTAALVNVVGVQYFQEADGVMYLLESEQTLKIASVL